MPTADHHAAPLAHYIRERMTERGIDSMSALARQAGLVPETVRRIFIGEGHPSERTLAQLAGAIGGSLAQMRLLAGRPPGEPEPFVLPPEANQLSRRERQVVLSMIWALLDAPDRGSAGEEDDGEPGKARSVPRLVSRLRTPDGPT